MAVTPGRFEDVDECNEDQELILELLNDRISDARLLLTMITAAKQQVKDLEKSTLELEKSFFEQIETIKKMQVTKDKLIQELKAVKEENIRLTAECEAYKVKDIAI